MIKNTVKNLSIEKKEIKLQKAQIQEKINN